MMFIFMAYTDDPTKPLLVYSLPQARPYCSSVDVFQLALRTSKSYVLKTMNLTILLAMLLLLK